MALLIDKGADVNAANKRKSTPSSGPCTTKPMVRLLLDRGANINAKTTDGRSLVYQASVENAIPVMRMLLDRGMDPNAKTLGGVTP
jgi:ankyrin repeat protein